jgi:hypothetical protein
MTGTEAFSRLPAGAGGTFHPVLKAVRVASFPRARHGLPHNRGMTKEELDRRCAEMRAKYGAARTGNGVPHVETRPTFPARQKAAPPPATPAVAPTSGYAIEKPHPLIKATLKEARGLRVGWRAQEPFLKTAGDGCVDLKVSPELLQRAAWIMDGFIKRFEREGFRVSVKDQSTLVELNGQSVPVRIREGLQQVQIPPEQRKDSWQNMLYRPNGTLHFEIVHSYSPDRLCSDSARWRLEEKADRIVEKLRERLEELKRREERWQAEKIMKQHEALREAERQRERAELRQRAESLVKDVEAWHQSEKIRAYLAAFRTTMEKWSGPIDASTEVGKWLDWASGYADSIDPLKPVS